MKPRPSATHVKPEPEVHLPPDRNTHARLAGKSVVPVSVYLATYAHIDLRQWLKCNGTPENAVPPPPIYGLKRSPTSDRYIARERHTTIVRGPNLNVAFPHL